MMSIRSAKALRRSKLGRGRARLMLAVGIAMSIPMAAQAQYYERDWGPYYGPRYGGPYGPAYDPYDDEGPDGRPGPSPNQRRAYAAPQQTEPRAAAVVPLEVIEHAVRAAGFRLVAPPRHKGNIYLAEVEDMKSVRHRLVYDANDGHLLENTPLGPVKKPVPPAAGEPRKDSKAAEPKPNSAGKESSGKAGPEYQNSEAAEQAKAVSVPVSPVEKPKRLPDQHMDEPAPSTPPPANDGK